MSKLTRREIMAAGAAAAVTPLLNKFPEIWIQGEVKPVVIASANGHMFRNGGKQTCVEVAWERMSRGEDVLDSLIAGVNLNELDPGDTSVGYGGTPNADGVVQLDSCCMHGAKNWAGGVAALEGVRTPSLVAAAVMKQTDHHLLVGKGAQEFAKNLGFTIEADLNTEVSRRQWLEWKRRTDPGHYLDPAKRDGRETRGMEALLSMIKDGLIDPEHAYGTINCDGINSKGEIAGVTTTSGLSFKIPGRVGDSPILGAGLYVDGKVGAAGSTGRGEANLFNLCSFLIVEEMRRGAHPKDAGLTALKRVAEHTEKRLQNDKGQPSFGLNFYAVDAKGRHGGTSMFKGATYAVCDSAGPRLEQCEPLFG